MLLKALQRRDERATTLLLKFGADFLPYQGARRNKEIALSEPYINHAFRGLSRIEVKLQPDDPRGELVSTSLFINSVTTFRELLIRMEKTFMREVFHLRRLPNGITLIADSEETKQMLVVAECPTCHDHHDDYHTHTHIITFEVLVGAERRKVRHHRR